MSTQQASRVTKENLLLVRNLIRRFPLPCACYEALFDSRGAIDNYRVVGINTLFEAIAGVEKLDAVGKTVIEAFGSLNQKAVEHLVQLGNKAYASEEKTGEAHISAFNHLYKTSFFFISDTLVLSIYEDIQPQFFRKYYRRSIPHDVIAKSIRERNAPVRSDEPSGQMERRPLPLNPLQAEGGAMLEVIPREVDVSEPYDAAFRDSLTGLYDRAFAAEALRMYIDRGVQPLSIVLGDVNGLNAINESAGYAAGDEILVRMAGILRDNCRTDDIVARWNDDGFIVVLPYASREETQRIIRRLQEALDRLCDRSCAMATFGYATSEQQPRTAEDMVREAEKWTFRKKMLVDQSHRSSTIRLLLSMLHEKSADTQEHSDRMSRHCRWVAERMGISDEMINDLMLLAMLHDIGKVGIPDTILNKPGPLTPEERAIIQQHPEIGHRITKTVPELAQVRIIYWRIMSIGTAAGIPRGSRGRIFPLPAGSLPWWTPMM